MFYSHSPINLLENHTINHCCCRYLHERFSQLQEEVNLLKSNIMKYKVQMARRF